MADKSHSGSRIWRAVVDHRARALYQLDALAANALRDLFRSGWRGGEPDPAQVLARRLARDLTALGMVVHDSSKSRDKGGVWLGPCAEYPGVVVAWTQHSASVAVLGPRRHCILQETMNSDLGEVLCALGYTVRPYGRGGAHVVAADS